MMISLDGFFEGPNHELDWHNVDYEFNEFAITQLKDVDLLLFGRRTYELMASYWPTEVGKKNDPMVAELMNNTPKIVFSKTLRTADWVHTRLVKENAIKEVSKLKIQAGKDMAIFGSSDLSVTLLEAGLLDELRIMVNPIVLGEGKRVFQGLRNQLNLKLLRTRIFNSGNILLHYKP
jgi:dihydrofolate reductase